MRAGVYLYEQGKIAVDCLSCLLKGEGFNEGYQIVLSESTSSCGSGICQDYAGKHPIKKESALRTCHPVR